MLKPDSLTSYLISPLRVAPRSRRTREVAVFAGVAVLFRAAVFPVCDIQASFGTGQKMQGECHARLKKIPVSAERGVCRTHVIPI